LKEHQEIAEALKIKDSKRADMLSKKHIESALKNFLFFIKNCVNSMRTEGRS
jgi:DNA-binding GntR family transcriptional regulator